MNKRLLKRDRTRKKAEDENRQLLERLDQLLSWIEQTEGLAIIGAVPSSIDNVLGARTILEGQLVLKGYFPEAMSRSMIADFSLQAEDGFGMSSLFRSIVFESDESWKDVGVAIVSVARLTREPLSAEEAQYWPLAEEVRQRLAKFLLAEASEDLMKLRDFIRQSEERSQTAFAEVFR